MIVGFGPAASKSCIPSLGWAYQPISWVVIDLLNTLDSSAMPEQYMSWSLTLQDRILAEYDHESTLVDCRA